MLEFQGQTELQDNNNNNNNNNSLKIYSAQLSI